jgi:hypothetical protein
MVYGDSKCRNGKQVSNVCQIVTDQSHHQPQSKQKTAWRPRSGKIYSGARRKRVPGLIVAMRVMWHQTARIRMICNRPKPNLM